MWLMGCQKIFRAPEETTYDFLTGSLELSGSIVARFFAPFYQVWACVYRNEGGGVRDKNKRLFRSIKKRSGRKREFFF